MRDLSKYVKKYNLSPEEEKELRESLERNERDALYENTRHIMDLVYCVKNDAIAEEKAKENPSQAVIDQLSREKSDLVNKQKKLYFHDYEYEEVKKMHAYYDKLWEEHMYEDARKDIMNDIERKNKAYDRESAKFRPDEALLNQLASEITALMKKQLNIYSLSRREIAGILTHYAKISLNERRKQHQNAGQYQHV